MYKNYVFDLYGTLIDIWTDEYSNEFWKKVGDLYSEHNAVYDYVDLHDRYIQLVENEKDLIKTRFPERKYIDIDLLNVFNQLYLDKGVKTNKELLLYTAKKFRFLSIEHICLYDGVLDLLDTLKMKRKKIYLLSNAQRSFTLPELESQNILKYFDGILISSDIKCSKPDVLFFSTLFNKYNIRKKDSIMIGNDWKSDILGAYNFGIDSLYIHQNISPPIEGINIRSNYKILDGDVYKIKSLIVN